jgi:hypothetical protein
MHMHVVVYIYVHIINSQTTFWCEHRQIVDMWQYIYH